jgi:hypothetical protein
MRYQGDRPRQSGISETTPFEKQRNCTLLLFCPAFFAGLFVRLDTAKLSAT